MNKQKHYVNFIFSYILYSPINKDVRKNYKNKNITTLCQHIKRNTLRKLKEKTIIQKNLFVNRK